MRRFDLNLLYTLRELLREPSTTRVGEKLGVTQSAVSGSLNRLRWAFDDELFVRSGQTMVPTKRAEELLEPVDAIMNQIEQLVETVRLEPDRMERTFRIMSGDIVLAHIIPELMEELRREAPGVTVVFETGNLDSRARIRSGHIDLAIAPLRMMAPLTNHVSHEVLFEDRLVGVASKHNDAVRKGVTLEDYLSMHHVIFRYENTAKSDILNADKQALKHFGVKLNVASEVTSLAILPKALKHTNLIAAMPLRILELLPEHEELQTFELPFDLAPFETGIFWNKSFDSDVEHRWLRELLQRRLAEAFLS